MNLLDQQVEDDVLVLRMQHGKANALNHALLCELKQVLERVGSDSSVKALVLGSGVRGFFSAGFDVREVFAYEGQQMQVFFGDFIDVYESLRRLPKAVVAAISGHAYAGGAVLAIHCDWRVMTAGRAGFAMNEINLGLSLPTNIAQTLVSLVGRSQASQMLFTGNPVDAPRALQMGLVNEVVPAAEVLEVSVQRAKELASKPAQTFAAIKEKLQAVSGLSNESDRRYMDEFADFWHSAEARSAREKIVRQLRH